MRSNLVRVVRSTAFRLCVLLYMVAVPFVVTVARASEFIASGELLQFYSDAWKALKLGRRLENGE